MPLTATAQPTNSPPRVQLNAFGVPGATATIYRTDPDGRARPVRTAEPATITGGSWAGFDYEAPFGVPVTYSIAEQPELLSVNQTSLETDTTGWLQVGNSTISRSTAQAHSGVASLQIYHTQTGIAYAQTLRTTASAIPVTPAVSYVASAYFRAATTPNAVETRIAWMDAAGVQIGTYMGTGGTTVQDTTTGWTLHTVTGVAPSNAAYAAVTLATNATAVGDVHYVDSISFRQVLVPVTVTLNVSDIWLIHPGVPSLSVEVGNVERLDNRTRSARSSVHHPLGRSTPIVVSELRAGVQTGLTLITETSGERDALWTLLGDGVPLLLNTPPSLGWGVTSEWMSVGDVTEEHLTPGLSDARRFALPYTVVDRPVGSLLAEWTWAGVLGKYASWNEVTASYNSWTDLTTNNVNEA